LVVYCHLPGRDERWPGWCLASSGVPAITGRQEVCSQAAVLCASQRAAARPHGGQPYEISKAISGAIEPAASCSHLRAASIPGIGL
jgi:hypothetical protein